MGRTAGGGRDAMEAAAYRALAETKRRKYGNVKTTVDGIEFDSVAEARRYRELLWLQNEGAIAELERQPRYPLVVNGVTVSRFTGDFRYLDMGTGQVVVEDVKSGPTRTRAYVMRRKLVKALYDIDIVEVE